MYLLRPLIFFCMRPSSRSGSAALRAYAMGALVLLVYSGTINPDNWVLCQGENGHRQVENVHEGCCAVPVSHQDHAMAFAVREARTTAGQSQCGGCVDTPLWVGGTKILPRAQTSAPKPLVQTHSVACLDDIADSACFPAKANSIFDPSSPHSLLQSIHTVILRV